MSSQKGWPNQDQIKKKTLQCQVHISRLFLALVVLCFASTHEDPPGVYATSKEVDKINDASKQMV